MVDWDSPPEYFYLKYIVTETKTSITHNPEASSTEPRLFTKGKNSDWKKNGLTSLHSPLIHGEAIKPSL